MWNTKRVPWALSVFSFLLASSSPLLHNSPFFFAWFIQPAYIFSTFGWLCFFAASTINGAVLGDRASEIRPMTLCLIRGRLNLSERACSSRSSSIESSSGRQDASGSAEDEEKESPPAASAAAAEDDDEELASPSSGLLRSVHLCCGGMGSGNGKASLRRRAE